MLLERPLSLKLIFHYYNQINRHRGRIIWMRDVLTNFLCFLFFYSLFHFTVFVAGLFLFLVFFFFSSSSFLPARCLPLFFFFLSFRVSLFIFLLLVCSCYFFLFTSFNSSIFLCPFRWCRVVMLKTVVYGKPGSFWILEELCWHMHQIAICYIVIYSITTTQ